MDIYSIMTNKSKREEYTLFKYKQGIEMFVKNTVLILYDTVEDFLDDHTYLAKFEDEVKLFINDDDQDSCQLFYHLNNIRNRVINNIEIFEANDGIDKIRIKEDTVKKFFKNIVTKAKEYEEKNEE
jgi:hypothetical protein